MSPFRDNKKPTINIPHAVWYNQRMKQDQLPGVYRAEHKDGSEYFRSSITYGNKHISLGSYDNPGDAHLAYTEAQELLSASAGESGDDNAIASFDPGVNRLAFDKWVVLCNYRDNGVYIPNPIYVRPRLFYYYFAPHDFFIFSGEDLFYYSAHRIQRRGGHHFVADYGSQINILSRYGIRPHAVAGKDYIFINGNPQDMQYSNIKVINPYHGVRSDGNGRYSVRIHVKGYLNVGAYDSAIEAAVAYNKAADILLEAGVSRQYSMNYIDGLSPKSYADIYTSAAISDGVINYKMT